MKPKVYALYCDELPERKAGLLQHLQERGVCARGWRGFYGSNWGITTRLEYEPGKRLPSGHVALNMGTWAMWSYALLSEGAGDTPVLFLEDDAVLPPDYHDAMSTLLADLDQHMPDWDLVFAGLAEAEPHVWHKVTERIGPPDSRLCKLNDPFGTHALLVRARAIPVLLENMCEARRNLDQQLFANVLQPNLLKWCAVLPTLIKQRTYDYTGGNNPEWGASCLEEAPAPAENVPAEQKHLLPARPRNPDPGRGPRPRATSLPDAYLPTLGLVDPLPCLYRGESLAQHGRHSVTGRSVPASECARLNVPCHDKKIPDAVTHGPTKRPVVACADCDLRLEMAPAGTARPRLDVPEGHFNPSVIQHEGRTIFATRDNWGHSRVGLWELTNTSPDWTGTWRTRPLASVASSHPDAPRLEDPRLFHDPDGALCAMFNLPDGYPPKYVQVGYCRFNRALTAVDKTEVYKSPAGNAYEKNWVPFVHDGGVHWVYASKPQHVVMAPGRPEPFATTNLLPWTGGVVRGGAAPVLHDGVYYHFFHGCIKRVFGSVYTVGCLTFEAKPPFNVLRQTAVPLVWPDLPAPGEEVVKQRVVWPGGAVPHAGAWHLAVGIDDTFCRIVRLPFATVEAALRADPDAVPLEVLASVRDGPIAKGVRFDDYGFEVAGE